MRARSLHQPGKSLLESRFSQLRIVLVVAATGIAAVAGCGPRSDRLEVSGNVTLDGAPLDAGSIRFTATGEKPLASGAMVTNGQYLIPQEHGLAPGKYHVEITSPDTKSPPVMARATSGGPGIPVARERIPAEYNTNSKHSIEVTPDGDNEFNFDIVSRAGK
jgi:hypothetical protein